MTKVKVNHSGNCTNPETDVTHYYSVDVPVDLPDEILEALGEENYEVIEDEGDDKPSYKDLQARAKELELPTNKKYDELAASIAEKEAEQEDEGDDK